MRSTLKNHLNQFGPDGLHTFNAGLSIEQAAAIGADEIKRSTLETYKPGDVVMIRGSDIRCRVKKPMGVTLLLEWPLPDWQSHDRLQVVSKGRYSYGTVEIGKAHVILVATARPLVVTPKRTKMRR